MQKGQKGVSYHWPDSLQFDGVHVTLSYELTREHSRQWPVLNYAPPS
jgi:hypothetical protein